jgi:hypothetical protein
MDVTPDWFLQGHLRDDLAKNLEPVAPSAVYIHTLKRPQVGMRTETEIQTKLGKWFLMSGIVISVDKAPTIKSLRHGDSFLWSVLSERVRKTNDNLLEEKKQYDFLTNLLGSVHGQQIKSINRISDTSGNRGYPGQMGFVAEITYRFNDHMYYPWVVEEFRVIRGDEIDRFGDFIYEYYEGCSCERCQSVPT